MKIYDLKDKEGRIFAFEIENWMVPRYQVCRIVKAIPGVRIKKVPRFFSWGKEDEFCEFELEGRTFVVMELFGDNSRYWIGPEPAVWCPQLEKIRAVFVRHRPFFGLVSG